MTDNSGTETDSADNTLTRDDGEFDRLKQEIKMKDAEYSSLKSKSDLLSESFEQVTKKIESIEKEHKEAVDNLATYKSRIEQLEEQVKGSSAKNTDDFLTIEAHKLKICEL